MAAPLYFEDFAVGDAYDCGAWSLTAAEITAFAEQFDPQPMHLDPAAAQQSMLGGHAASGWHVCALGMRLFHDGLLNRVRGQGSPGIAETRWRRPARAGARLGLTLSIAESRPSRSRPSLGLVGFATRIEDRDRGETVCVQRFSVLIERRAPPAPKMEMETETETETATVSPRRPAPASEADANPLDGAGPPPPWRRAGEIPIGRTFDLGAETVSAEAIIAFAEQFDPQPFHLDREAGRASLFGGLAASGWHTAALWMRRQVLARRDALATLDPAARADAAAAAGPGLGFVDLAWRRPVLEGDRLRFFTRVAEVAPFEARPGWARVVADNGAVNQKGAVALRFRSEALARL